MKQNNILKAALGLLILIGFVIAVEIYFGWRELLAPWRALPLPTICLAVVLAFISYWVRTQRLYDYFYGPMRGGYWLCFRLVLQHNLLNNLLPMRTGELSFPVLMARDFAIPALHSVPALFWFRILDLHTLGVMALLAAGHFWLPAWLTLILALGWLLLPWGLFHAHHWLQRQLASRQQGKIQSLMHRLLTSLPQTSKAFWRAWLWTMLNWIVKLGVFAWVLLLFADMPISAAWIGAIAGDLTSVLPVHGVAGAGTYEAGVVAGMMLFQIKLQQALPAAINLHLFVLGSTLIGGLLSLLLSGRRAHG